MNRKLHIGGKSEQQGWELLNVNKAAAPRVDHVEDASNLQVFDDNTFAAIYASHVLEHFNYAAQLKKALSEWRRVLLPGGRIYISVPDLDILTELFRDRKKLTKDERFFVMRMMFGGQVDKFDFHVAGLNEEFLTDYLQSEDFVNIERVKGFGLFDDSSNLYYKGVLISLNVVAEKPQSGQDENACLDDLPALQRENSVSALDTLYRVQGQDTVSHGKENIYEDVSAIDIILGDAYSEKEKYDQAIEHYQKAYGLLNTPELRQNPANRGRMARLNDKMAAAHKAVGQFQSDEGAFEEAIEAYKNALLHNERDYEIYFKIGFNLNALKLFDEAIEFYNRSLALNPRYAACHLYLANTYHNKKRFYKAKAHYEEYVRLSGDEHNIRVLLRLGYIDGRIGLIDQAIKRCEQVLHLDPTYRTVYQQLPMHVLKNCSFTQKDVAKNNRTLLDTYVKALQPVRPPVDVFADRKKRPAGAPLNIGYVTGDLYNHTVMQFLEPILAHHNREQFVIHCFSNVQKPDVVTQRIIDNYELNYVDISELDDADAAALILDTGVDILVDLGGHTNESRALVLVYKPAPVQVTYLGYPNTTGIEAIDYILADRGTILDNEAHLFTEKPFYIDGGYECFKFHVNAGKDKIKPLPALQNRFTTFGFFNHLSKINTRLIRRFAEILKASPTSRLLFHRSDIDDERRKDLYAQFQAIGVGPQQLIMSNKPFDYVVFSEVDIALDAFPYNGTTTTLDCLAMGTPVVCVYGDGPHSRASARILNRAGLSELVAQNEEEFVRLAVDLAQDPERMTMYRKTLRQRLEDSPLCDHKGFTASLEATYRKMWDEWLRARATADAA